jgi:hypothetical protein
MQRAGRRHCLRAGAPPQLPLALQRLPHRAPVLRRRFHHDFLDVALGEPLGELLQLRRAGSELPAFKSPFPLDFLWTSTPALRYGIRISWRERRTCLVSLTQGHGLSSNDAHLFAQARTFRIIQFNGFNCSTGSIDLTARATAILATPPQIFIQFRVLSQRVGTRC